ncbi:MAG: hypothetical protein DMF53_01170 [Acidobacteria bacterium]|nr:MAG: hypothetical protein DMF53_01170 [Acidobacteriota bacterium]
MGYGEVYLNPRKASAAVPAPAAAPVPVVPSPPAPIDEEAAGRIAELAALAGVAEACTRCRLAEGRTKVVFGSGNPTAELMFVGEGPGADEDRQGLPFVGAAGELLTACRGYLDRQIALVRPRALVALGKVAAQALLGNDAPIGRMRGQWYQVQGVPTMVTYHPAALLRNQALKRPTWEDMQQVRDFLRSGNL